MNKENTRKLMYILIVITLIMSLIFGYTDNHKSDWKGNPVYFEEFAQ